MVAYITTKTIAPQEKKNNKEIKHEANIKTKLSLKKGGSGQAWNEEWIFGLTVYIKVLFISKGD